MSHFSFKNTYGIYTVIEVLDNDFYKVQCEICNKKTILIGEELFSIINKCRCKRNTDIILEVGKKIDKLLLLECVIIKKDNKKPAKYWKVECECGNVLLRSRSYLLSRTLKYLKSCGCSNVKDT